jgi:two-component system OmpR family sensor kinase
MTLRSKLVLVLLALLSLGSLLVAAGTSFALRDFLIKRLDQQLAAAGNRYSVSLEHPSDGDADDAAFGGVTGQATGTLGARVAGGRVTAAEIVGRKDDPTAAAKTVLARLHPSRAAHTIELPGVGTYRVLVSSGNDGDTLITGLPEETVDDTIRRLLVIELVGFLVVLAVIGVSTAVSVRLTLRPLNRVADTALRVSDLPLSTGIVSLPERAPGADPRTEVGKVSEAFNHMLEHVESALHQRQESEDRLRRFIADASHELRTPVAIVRSHAEYAQRTNDQLPAAAQESLTRIAAESERMGHLVEDLLLLARLDSGRPLATDPVDLTRIVIDCVSDARITGPDHRWQLDLPDEPVSVRGDAGALHQLLANLLTNARIHTPPGTTVDTELSVSSDVTALTISDDGPGMPAGLLPTVFERFVRGDEVREQTTGSSGLGLAIVQAIVQAHHGELALHSDSQGTRIEIKLPDASA